MLSALGLAYSRLPNAVTRKDIWNQEECECALVETLQPLKLDSAYAGMRRVFFHTEDERQLAGGTKTQCECFSTRQDAGQRMKQKKRCLPDIGFPC